METVGQLLIQNNLKFVCFGGGEFTIEEMKLIIRLGLKDHVLFVNYNDDASLKNLYTNALFFIFPSMYEGFGLPLLEAFACDCPVLSSSGGSLQEIGGDAAIYFNPYDSQSLYISFLEMVQSDQVRNNCIEKGRLREKEFSWNKTFDETINVYKSVLE